VRSLTFHGARSATIPAGRISASDPAALPVAPLESLTITLFFAGSTGHWIRTSGEFDAMVDFAKALADPADPEEPNPACNSGDFLRPNDAGYRAIAAAIKLNEL
jgi:hypothetical protein